MFISKKKFNEAIEKAQNETAEKIYQERRMHDFEHETLQEFDRIKCEFANRNYAVNERLERLEKAVFKNTITGVVDDGKSELK